MTTDESDAHEPRLKPRITMTAGDYNQLSALAHAARNRMPDLASELAGEVERAEILPNGTRPEHIVCMGSEVEYRDDKTGKIQKVTLVYPGEADISEGKVSVLTPVGTALIGLRVGGSMTWVTPRAEIRQLTVLRVSARRSD